MLLDKRFRFILNQFANKTWIYSSSSKKNISTSEYLDKIKKCYKILEVEEDCDQETIRQSYLKLVKKYHPDSGSPDADVDQFQKIEAAYRILNKKNAQDRWDVSEQQRIKEFDIKHTAPQHRQYLSYDGLGIGTPAQREKHYSNVRASRASQNVMEHRIAKATAAENALMDKNTNFKQKHDIKTPYGFDRLVEDLIQESMSKGEFNNLKGSGKPLPTHQNTNPYMDFVTHKMNQVLIDNGFTPEWITLQKDISRMIEDLRSILTAERRKLGPVPLSPNDEYSWSEVINKKSEVAKRINSKITHYNLLVPILQKQMLFVSIEKEALNILQNGKDKTHANSCENKRHDSKHTKNIESDNSNILATFMSIFKL